MMFMISVLSVCCCALLNFESFIHVIFFLFNFFNFIFIYILFNICCCFVVVMFGLFVPLNGIKKYLA